MPGRPIHLILGLFTLVGVILVLRLQYPEQMAGSNTWLYSLHALLWLLVIGGSWRIQQLGASTTIKYAAIWLGIIAALMLFHSLMQRFV